MKDASGNCAICGWPHEEEDEHHAYEPGAIDLYEVLCPDGKRRHLLRATEYAAEMCASRADSMILRCGARLPGIEHIDDRCPGTKAGKHTFRLLARTDPRYLPALAEDSPDVFYNRLRGVLEHPVLLPGMPIRLELAKDLATE